MIYVLNLPLIPTLLVCNDGRGEKLVQGVRFREFTADKEERQWNACQNYRDRGKWGYGADGNKMVELWNNICLFQVKRNMNNS